MSLANETSKSLEHHLKLICEGDPKYSKLHATWELDKRVFKDVLIAINYNYPHFSMHEISHSESIINKIEMVLGEKRIAQLGPTETWMILQSAQVHDFGMVLRNDYVKEIWRGEDFQSFLELTMKSSLDSDLKNAANFIYTTTYKNTHSNDSYTSEKDWPVELRRSIVQLVAEYFRDKHSDLSKTNIHNCADWGLDFTHNGLIPSRLINLLGQIAQLHGKNFDEVLILEWQANGVGIDIIHPRFIACLLRLGDLLDMDNGRFNPFLNMAFGKMPTLSLAHAKKHAAIEHFLITPDRIEVIANCLDDSSYRATRQWCDWIIEEVKLLAVNWLQIAPNGFDGSPPRIGKVEVLLRGRKNSVDVANLQFDIDLKDAFELFEGANVYESKLAFVRELYQNALDATKIRLWQDILDGYYLNCFQNWSPEQELLPYHIKDGSLLDNYKIVIEINFDKPIGATSNDETTFHFSIRDRGIGICDEDLENMTHTGKSWSRRPRWAKLIRSMPRWLRPTGTFGIGLQSVFSVTDTLKAYTRAEGEAGKEIIFASRKGNGYISVASLSPGETMMQRGTEMLVEFTGVELNSIKSGSYVDQQLKKVDYFTDNMPENVFMIIEELLGCAPNLFLTEIYLNGNKYFALPVLNIDKNCFFEEDVLNLGEGKPSKVFKYALADDLSNITIFENELQSLITIQFPVKDNHSRGFWRDFNFRFKGIEASFNNRDNEFLQISWDIMGMETKECLTLNREKVRKDRNVQNKLKNVLFGATKFAIVKFADKLSENVDSIHAYNRLDYFRIRLLFEEMLTTTEYERSKYGPLLRRIGENSGDVLIEMAIKHEGQFILSKLLAKDFFVNFDSMAVILYNVPVREKEDVIQMLNRVDQETPVFFKHLILNDELQRWYSKYWTPQVQSLSDDIYVGNVIDPLSPPEETKHFSVDEITKKRMLKSIKHTKRGLIPPLADYFQIIVSRVPPEFWWRHQRGIGDRWRLTIISPVTDNDIEELHDHKITVDGLVRSLALREDFNNLVQWVWENQVATYESKVSIEEIKTIYYQLAKDIAEAFETRE